MNESQTVVVLSNISVEPFFVPILQEKFLKSVIAGKIIHIPYSEYLDSIYQDTFKHADLVVVWLNLEILFPELYNDILDDYLKEHHSQEVLGLCHNVAEYIVVQSNATVFWLLFEDYFMNLHVVTGHKSNLLVEKINLGLENELSDRITYIDLKHLIAEKGIGTAFSVKNKYRWNFPYSKALVLSVTEEIQKQYLIANGISKKCLILDCDNVLWGGILSEEGMEGIILGSSGLGWEYQEFQRFVLSLYKRGVILAICTKNDLQDVLCVFQEHSGMILKEEHIACFRANWDNKPDNIKQIAEILNISTESMVFIDDSELEVEAVKALIPEVTVIRYDREQMYKDFSCFNLKDNICHEEIANRNKTYRTNQYRQELKTISNTYEEYISALKMRIDIHETLDCELARIVELTQRTNKCTNGVRCTLQNVIKWIASGDICLYSVLLADKFSDLGLVGVIGVQGNKLLLFCLSCRALGRGIEEKMIRYIQERHQIAQVMFIDTSKNDHLRLLFRKYFVDV